MQLHEMWLVFALTSKHMAFLGVAAYKVLTASKRYPLQAFIKIISDFFNRVNKLSGYRRVNISTFMQAKNWLMITVHSISVDLMIDRERDSLLLLKEKRVAGRLSEIKH